MSSQIDQSGKIEQTRLDTVIALSNSASYSILLKKADKRLIKLVFKRMGYPKLYVQIVFAALVAICIHESKHRGSILIDTEYLGYNDLIRDKIHFYLKKLGVRKVPVIRFGFVGKESVSHDFAAKVAHKKLKPSKTINLQEILRLVLTNKKSGIA